MSAWKRWLSSGRNCTALLSWASPPSDPSVALLRRNRVRCKLSTSSLALGWIYWPPRLLSFPHPRIRFEYLTPSDLRLLDSKTWHRCNRKYRVKGPKLDWRGEQRISKTSNRWECTFLDLRLIREVKELLDYLPLFLYDILQVPQAAWDSELTTAANSWKHVRSLL